MKKIKNKFQISNCLFFLLKLFIICRYLATGLAFRQLAMAFRISKTAVSNIVIEVCIALWNSLKNKHMSTPTVDDFKNIANEFYKKWNFPNCVGSLDGKHIRMKCPKNSGSMFFNYKQYYSIVLMAVSDANYRFVMIDVGSYGKDSDGSVLCNTQFYQRLENGTLKLPKLSNLPNSNLKAPYVFVGDEAFPLRNYIMRPFPRQQLASAYDKKHYNYRLSRARMTIECAFGIASSKFRILQKSIETKVENADHIVKAICILHNVIIDRENESSRQCTIISENFNIANVQESNKIMRLRANRSNNRASRTAIDIRNIFVEFFKTNNITETNM